MESHKDLLKLSLNLISLGNENFSEVVCWNEETEANVGTIFILVSLVLNIFVEEFVPKFLDVLV